MSFSINTNVGSLQAREYLRISGEFQTKTISRVTSGLRITSSGDDAAGLAIANNLRSDQAVLTQGIRNANDGLAQLQIADGGINNVSRLLDRARTLATQSASGTFTGDRTVLNSEFQSVLTEINRQAQAIGLNIGGTFARSLSVFIGGGKDSGASSAISNGSVSVDLSRSTVDAASLGLQGNRITGVNTTNLSSILANSTNTGSQTVAGQSEFVFRGAGFGDGIKVSVNTTGSPNATALVDRLNAAITAAGQTGSSAATAFGNAKVRASLVTDASGNESLVFNSPGAAFQVDGGDRLANALLGRTERNPVVTSTNTAAFVDTDTGTATDNALTFAFNGGAQFTVSITGTADANNVSKGEIVRQLNADATFSAGAVAYLDGNRVALKSKTNTADATLQVVASDLATSLGFTAGTTTAGAENVGADLSNRVQGRDRTSNQARLVGAATTFNFTVNDGTTDNLRITVGATSAAIDLANATYTSASQVATALNTSIGSTSLTGLVSASVVNGRVVLTAANPNSSVGINDEGADNTLAANIFGASRVNTVASQSEFATSDTIRVRFSGGGLSSAVDLTLDTTTAGTTTVQQAIDDLRVKVAANSSLTAAGITLTTDSAGNNLTFTSKSGEQFNVQVTGDTLNTLGFGSYLSGDSPNQVEYSSITAAANYSTGTASGNGTARLQISIGGGASDTNEITATLAGGDASRASTTGTALGATQDLSTNTGTLDIAINGTTYNVNLGTGATTARETIANTINQAISAAGRAYLNSSNQVVIESNAVGAAASIQILSSSSASSQTFSGLTAGAATNGANASLGNVLDQLNDAIQGDAELRSAGIRAVQNGSAIQLESTNGTFFRVASRVTGSDTADIGFGNLGSSYAGPLTQNAALTNNRVNSGGAEATTLVGFNRITNGADDQSVTISALDSNGVAQTATVTLRNDATSRSGRSIDEAVATINAALQASSSASLQNIVAVKESDGTNEGIRFIGSTKNFSVQASTTLNGGGIDTTSANNFAASTLTGGSNLVIDNQSSAEAAVTALASAVSTLGRAQAVVGRGQNQFNFAINLASSQLTNLAASESRIRDADLAAEAANLSRAQISLQAGVAALAQANSAPQAVLSLLRG